MFVLPTPSKYFFRAVALLVLLFAPFHLWASSSLPFDLTYPSVTKASKIKQQEYDRLEVYVKGKGYQPIYGQTWEQDFKYPKSSNNVHKKAVKDFIANSLNIKPTDFNKKNIAHFNVGEKEYWLKLSTYATSYSYQLLRVSPYPQTVTLNSKAVYTYTKKYKKKFGEVPFEKNIAVPHVKGYAISRVIYKNYDEKTFYYGRKASLHKGKFWKIDFSKEAADKNSGRYAVPHDYKSKIIPMGATVLKDKDNVIHFKLEDHGAINIIKLDCGNSNFSVTIIQEETFKQSLVLTPDSIKAELDKTGKITLDGIYFDFNKATLKPASNKAIISATALMQSYPDLILSIHGHTDSKGSDQYNLKLSADRAAAVRQAIIDQGIKGNRLQSKGYGETEPIASNDTDKGRAQNRRVELHKVSGGNKKLIISIDFIKPLENSVMHAKRKHKNGSLGVQYTKPYSQQKKYEELTGSLNIIEYNIMKDGVKDKNISRKEIIMNYANVLELYNAKLLGNIDNTLYFKIDDRGDGHSIYGRIEAYTASYHIKFLVH